MQREGEGEGEGEGEVAACLLEALHDATVQVVFHQQRGVVAQLFGEVLHPVRRGRAARAREPGA